MELQVEAGFNLAGFGPFREEAFPVQTLDPASPQTFIKYSLKY